MCDCEACFISFETEKNRPPSGVQAAARQAGRGLSRPASVASHGIYMKRAARLSSSTSDSRSPGKLERVKDATVHEADAESVDQP
jgi:hypothetical protein